MLPQRWSFPVLCLLAVAVVTGLPAKWSTPAAAQNAEVADPLVVDPDAAHADPEHADEEAHAAGPLLNIDPGSAIWNLLIFLVVFFVLAKFVWPPVLQGLQAREQKIRSDLEGAERANADAKGLLAEYQRKLDQTHAEVQAMLAEARRDAQQAHQKIVDEAKLEAERQRTRAVADIENAKKVALSEMADQTSEMAIRLARQVVGRELNSQDHADLIRQSLDRMPSQN